MMNKIMSDNPSIVWVNESFIDIDRIDPIFYKTNIMDLVTKIEGKFKVDYAENLFKVITDGDHGKRDYVDEGVPFYTAINVQEEGFNSETHLFITEKYEESLKRARLSPNSLLIVKTGVGTGKSCVIGENISYGNISADVGILKEPSNIIDPYFISVFMNSKSGREYILRSSYGSTRNRLTIAELKRLKLPIPSLDIQNYIGNKVRKAEQLREEAKRLRTEVKEMFYDYTLLDREKDTSQDSIENSTNEWGMFVETRNITNLLGAEVYKSDYVENQNTIRSLNSYVNFDDCFEYIVNGVDIRNYRDNATAYYKVAAIDMFGVKEGSVDFVDISIDSINAKQRIKEGDLLITRKGSFGISMGVQTRDTNGIISSEVFKVRLKSGWDADYLAYFLNSRYGQKQFLQFATGSTMKGISQQNIVEIVVPKIKYHKQQEIGLLVRNIKDLYYQSKELIQQAKNDIEYLIEDTWDETLINLEY
ncbi:restriction endonuclease subunit S [Rossellomorea sp. DA94]|uniref:restriction endonuclease subunit S n=1 Tax=Rossellomorea sp. DA94 TaxID=3038653 RepID=UPI0024472863|nr:restriction endonuclease subunit S [Rossellomorea sp. DA94]WGG46469.1 restriction endonuclease subunit S [Rossellomorea sp. DA94]